MYHQEIASLNSTQSNNWADNCHKCLFKKDVTSLCLRQEHWVATKVNILLGLLAFSPTSHFTYTCSASNAFLWPFLSSLFAATTTAHQSSLRVGSMTSVVECSKLGSFLPKGDQDETVFLYFFWNEGMQIGWLLETWILLDTNEPNFVYPILILHNLSHVK